ncbi:hypothetical protein KO561_05230 [Radiobacillus kanasensis]|nr:hypothetical protein [Radiobacillus kanasensis]UFU00353.1 hypothetical protein KO561_05230 [Radiobacillus kanasensis]
MVADDREHLEVEDYVCEYCLKFGMGFEGENYDPSQCECTEHEEDRY